MSGPKTSHISIEEQIRTQLMAADKTITAVFSRVQAEMDRAEDRIEVLVRSLDSCGESQFADHILKQTREALDRASAELSEVRAQRTVLDTRTSISQIDLQANSISSNIRAIKGKTLRALEPLVESLEESLKKEQRNKEASSFAAMLHGVLAEDATPSDAIVSTANDVDDLVDAALKEENATAEATLRWEDIAENVGDAVSRYTSVMSHLEYLTSKTARVLIEHGARFLDAVEQCAAQQDASADQFSQATLHTVSNQVNIMRELLPSCEREAVYMREIITQVEELERILSPSDLDSEGVLSTFASLDDAEHYLESLKMRRIAARQQEYLRSCIDEVMARHGYDIARSVTLHQQVAGEHLVFGNEEADEGIHVFVSQNGDMMMEAVGVSDPASIVEGDQVRIAKTGDADQANYLLEFQEGFCAVYAEIADELEAYGIHMNTIHRFAPSVEYSKELQLQQQVENDHTHAQAATAKAQPNAKAKAPMRRKRHAAALKERAL